MVENNHPIISLLLRDGKLEQTKSQNPGLNGVVRWNSYELTQTVLQATDDSRARMKADTTSDVQPNGSRDGCDGVFVIGQFKRNRLVGSWLASVSRKFFLVLP